jgi:hypothetical protein
LYTAYYANPSDARHTAGEAEYGARFTAAIARDNIFATQFHPEKSADTGIDSCTAIFCTGTPEFKHKVALAHHLHLPVHSNLF